jgi:N-acetylglucosamine malate deacetylase 1
MLPMPSDRQVILAIAAHPDDEVIGAGGTLAKHARDGDEVYVAILTEGSSVQFPGQPSYTEIKRAHARAAAEVLGVSDVFFGSFPDQRMDTVPVLEVNQFIEKLVRELRPSIVYTHHFADLNRDHRVIYEATMVATRPFSLPSLRQLLCYYADPLGLVGMGGTHFNVFSVIDETLETKLAAMRCYETEVRDYPNPRSIEGLEYIARRNGAAIGAKAAELFQSILHIR